MSQQLKPRILAVPKKTYEQKINNCMTLFPSTTWDHVNQINKHLETSWKC
jgi:hypothetical protein